MDTTAAVRGSGMTKGMTKCFGEVVALDSIDPDVVRSQLPRTDRPGRRGQDAAAGRCRTHRCRRRHDPRPRERQSKLSPTIETQPQARVRASSRHLPDVAITGPAIDRLDVTANGRYFADGDGPDPLWQFDGRVELLPSR